MPMKLNLYAESNRLIYRPLQEDDLDAMFELDSDPEVHRYLGNKPIVSREEAAQVIRFVQQQYRELGIGRWAIVEKETGEFVGWGGLKKVMESGFVEAPYFDLGYRLLRRFWGNGYATENAFASKQYAFNQLKSNQIFACAHQNNLASNSILKKIGMHQIGEGFFEDEPLFWYKIENEMKHA
ncbi:GNAT family N-acetyltransferase [Bacteroidota bacterium]